MNWLTLAYFISLGTLAYNGQFLSPLGQAEIVTPPSSFQTTLGVELQGLDNHLFVGGSVETWETSAGGALFSPSESLYKFSAGLRWNGLELGYRHECDHLTIDNFSLPSQGFEVERHELYLSYTGKLKLF